MAFFKSAYFCDSVYVQLVIKPKKVISKLPSAVIVFILMQFIKTYFYWKSFALSRVLKARVLENSLLMLWWKVFSQSLHYFENKLFIYYCAFDYNIQYVHSYLYAINF